MSMSLHYSCVVFLFIISLLPITRWGGVNSLIRGDASEDEGFFTIQLTKRCSKKHYSKAAHGGVEIPSEAFFELSCHYFIPFTVSSQQFFGLFDTGSSITWIAGPNTNVYTTYDPKSKEIRKFHKDELDPITKKEYIIELNIWILPTLKGTT